VLAGVAPFEADNAADMIAKHLTETPRRLRERMPAMPAAVDEVVMAMLAKSPSARPPLERVKAVLAELAAGPRMPTPVPVAREAPGPAVRFAPAPEAALELAVAPRTPTMPAMPAMPAAPVVAAPVAAAAPRGSGAMIATGVAIVIAAGVAVFLIKHRGGHDAPPAAGGDAIATGGGASAARVTASGSAPALPPVPADATLDVTLIGAARATIAIDGDERPLWKGAPETIPVPAGRHDVTVTASGFRTFHTSINAVAGARLAVTARLEPAR
jgi:serine/threonine-protein kinase